MTNKKKLLFISNSSPERLNHILDGFLSREDLEVKVLNQNIAHRPSSLLSRFFEKCKIPLDFDDLNSRLVEATQNYDPDIIFIVKGNLIYPKVLAHIRRNYPNTVIVSWSLDDMYAWHNRSLFYTRSLRFYDLVFTSKSYNIVELKSLGAKKVIFLYQAFSKIYHKPYSVQLNQRGIEDILFIGFAEKSRFDDLNYLASNNLKIAIYGSGWNKKRYANYHKNLSIHAFDLIGDDYARAISNAKITLCFLRKANRDLHTTRSIEIPAIGGFMIAERTNEHKVLFEEDKEAIYFDSKEELLEKVTQSLNNDSEREIIRAAGHRKCIEEDYSYDNMANLIMEHIDATVR